ncbi:MAG TPA: adenosine kinase [Fibrobacteria bacterium]|nr:adenosine kinase [Fibrobacteria bacterium]HOX51735.1 adenosine kinase [Fibrobacteria bacterium]
MSRYQQILGVGAALLDLLAHVPDEFVAATQRPKGGMTLVDPPDQKAMLARLPQGWTEAPGGSACNTLVGLSRLGSSARFLGKRGCDEVGDRLEASLKEAGLALDFPRGTTDTGTALSLVTPDAQRTMFTSLGASAQFSPSDLDSLSWKGVGLVYLEGYLLFNTPFFDAVLSKANGEGIPVILDCGSFDVVQIFRDKLREILAQRRLAGLLANEDESRALTETDPENSLEWIAQHVDLAVVKLGARGALLAQGGKQVIAGVTPVAKVVDTTGAGDLWASGLISGLDRGWDLAKAAHLASLTAAEVIQVLGAQIPVEGWERIRQAV